MDQPQSDNTTGITHILREKSRAAKLRRHIEDKGEKCWYCGSQWIDGFPAAVISKNTAEQTLYCHDCGRKWKHIYKLADVDLEYVPDPYDIGEIE